jgi:hypothetical protein
MIDLDDYRVGDVIIDDIANSLSKQCRYNGNIPGKAIYSVAEHAPYVARLAKLYILQHEAPFIEQWSNDDKAMCCLGAVCHDNPEYITGDITRPIKRHISNFREIEAVITPIMEKAFGIELTDEMHAVIKRADDVMADIEMRYFFPWKVMGKAPSEYRLTDFSGVSKPGLPPSKAKRLFMVAFNKAIAGKWTEL